VDEINKYTNTGRLWTHVKLCSTIPNHTYIRLPQLCVCWSPLLMLGFIIPRLIIITELSATYFRIYCKLVSVVDYTKEVYTETTCTIFLLFWTSVYRILFFLLLIIIRTLYFCIQKTFIPLNVLRFRENEFTINQLKVRFHPVIDRNNLWGQHRHSSTLFV
jgi:hypothetical protein